MPVLVDGSNLLHSLPPDGRSREVVRRLTLALVRGERIRVTVVFDGPPPSGAPATESLGAVSVVYSGGATADDVIVRRLPTGPPARQWVVVTDDRGLAARCRGAGAEVRSLAEWRARLNRADADRPDRPDGPARGDDLVAWETAMSGPRTRDDGPRVVPRRRKRRLGRRSP